MDSEPDVAPLKLDDLTNGPLASILECLTIKDICSATQACRALRDAARNDRVWHRKAEQVYGCHLTNLNESYAFHLDLLKDDNAANASLFLQTPKASCDYKHNRDNYYFEAIVTSVQLNRSQDRLIIYFDARGEADLRKPLHSSLAIVHHRPHCTSRLELRKRLAELKRKRAELELVANNTTMHGESYLPDSSAIASSSDSFVARSAAARAALHSSYQAINQIHRELLNAPGFEFGDLLHVVRPLQQTLVIEKPGHFKGKLEFRGEALLTRVLEQQNNRRRVLNNRGNCDSRGFDLIFCYANPLPLMPHEHLVDYHPVQLLHIPAASSSLAAAMKLAGASYVDHEEALLRLREESEENDKARWAHVPEEVMQRSVGAGDAVVWYV